MKFTLEITCDNAAFEESREAEVGRILAKLGAKLLRHVGDDRVLLLYDVNGNTVGRCRFSP